MRPRRTPLTDDQAPTPIRAGHGGAAPRTRCDRGRAKDEEDLRRRQVHRTTAPRPEWPATTTTRGREPDEEGHDAAQPDGSEPLGDHEAPLVLEVAEVHAHGPEPGGRHPVGAHPREWCERSPAEGQRRRSRRQRDGREDVGRPNEDRRGQDAAGIGVAHGAGHRPRAPPGGERARPAGPRRRRHGPALGPHTIAPPRPFLHAQLPARRSMLPHHRQSWAAARAFGAGSQKFLPCPSGRLREWRPWRESPPSGSGTST